MVGPNGITAKTMNAGIKRMTGARVKIQRSARAGTMSSFSISFRPVGDRLKQAPRTDAHRSETDLHEGDDLAFQQVSDTAMTPDERARIQRQS